MTFPLCFIQNGLALPFLLPRGVTDEFVSPLNEILHVRRVRVATIMLAPCKLTGHEALILRGHLRRVIIPLHVETFGAKQRKHSTRVHGCHQASLMIEPVSLALLWDSIADEVEARRAA